MSNLRSWNSNPQAPVLQITIHLPLKICFVPLDVGLEITGGLSVEKMGFLLLGLLPPPRTLSSTGEQLACPGGVPTHLEAGGCILFVGFLHQQRRGWPGLLQRPSPQTHSSEQFPRGWGQGRGSEESGEKELCS